MGRVGHDYFLHRGQRNNVRVVTTLTIRKIFESPTQ